MSTASVPAPSTSPTPPPLTSSLPTRDARTAGLAYLGLAISGMVGFLLIRQQLHVPADAAATAANLVRDQTLARVGVVTDLAIVATQALAAIGFLRLFHPVDRVRAHAVAAFGMVNAVVILIATACTATALQVALDGGSADTVGLLYQLSDATWAVGALFFGLWLIPMGLLVRSAGMPRALGLLLVVSGIGYIASAVLLMLAPDAQLVGDLLAGPATIAEFWMIGYLLFRRAPKVVAL